jgi:hypothetical protein
MSVDVERQRAELERAEANYERAKLLEQIIPDLKRDVARAEQRRDAFASYGARRVEVPNPHTHVAGMGDVELEPFLSVLSGKELAKRVERDEIDPLKAEIKRLEVEAEALSGR